MEYIILVFSMLIFVANGPHVTQNEFESFGDRKAGRFDGRI